MHSIMAALKIWAIMVVGFALVLWAWAASAQDANPEPKLIAVLVVVYIGPDALDKPRHHSEAFDTPEECLRESALIRALWQGRGAIGDLGTHCVVFKLAPWARRHS